MEIVIIISATALIVGAMVGYLVAKMRSARSISRIEVLEVQLQMARDNAQAMLRRADETHASTLDALQRRFDETVAKMKAELENVTAEMLSRRQAEFEMSSREGVSRILEPLNKSISEMRRAVTENTIRHSEMGGQLSSGIRLVMEHSDAARKSADRLADALR